MGLFLVWPLFFRTFLLAYGFLGKAGWVSQNPDLGKAMADPAGGGQTWTAIVSFILVILIVIMYFRSKGALIAAVSQLRHKTALDKKMAYDESEPYTIQMVKLGVGFAAAALVITSLLASPVAYLSSNDYPSRASALGILSALIYVPLMAFVYYTAVFAPMFMVLHRMTVGQSLRASLDLVLKRWPALVAFTLGMACIEVVAVVAILALVAVGMSPFVLLLNVFYDTGGPVALGILQGLAGIVGFMVFFMSLGLLAAFQRIAWTIVYFEISKPVKSLEAVEAETLPEVIT
jgi:hypothetical protein